MLRQLHRLAILLSFFVVLALTGCANANQPVPAATSPAPAPTQADRVDPIPVEATPQVTPPRVVKRLPLYQRNDDRSPAFTLTFDRPMDPASVATALSVEPAVPFSLRWEAVSVHIEMLQPLTPGEKYGFTLAQTATDLNGLHLKQDYQWNYRPVSLISSKTYPRASDPDAPLVIFFNYALDPQSVRQALTIEPALGGNWNWNDQHTRFTFTPTAPYLSETNYTIGFGGGELLDSYGDPFPLPEPICFTTPPPILAATPDSQKASPASAVRITFDRLMDQAATEAAFQISPPVVGHFEWSETTLIFVPEVGYLDERTSYDITMEASALALDGAPILKKDYTWSFRTGALEAVASFGYGPNAQVVDRDGRRAVQFGLVSPEAPLVTFELYRLRLEQFLDRYSSGFRGVAGTEDAPISLEGVTLSKEWQVDTAQSLLTDYGMRIHETILPADVPAGAYILNLTAGRLNDQLILLLTTNTIAVKQAEGRLLAWVTDVNGESVPGIEVGVYARNGQLLSQGHTDNSGVYSTQVERDPQPLIVVARAGDDLTAAGLSNEWRSPMGNWEGWWQPAPRAQNYAAYIYTDRPIYRPGQTVYFKAILRRDEDALLSPPAEGATVTARMRDARNNIVQTVQLATNPFGTVNGEFHLAEGAMLGSYRIETALDGETHSQVFKVQDYRKPDYRVTLAPDSNSYVVGDTIKIDLEASYFYGKPVPDASMVVKQYELGQNYCWWEGCTGEEYIWYESYRQPVRATTDAGGRFSFTLPAEQGYYGQIGDWRSNLQESSWGIEVTVDDGSHQTVSSFLVVKVFNAAEQLHLDTGGYLKTPGQAFTVHARAATLSGQPVSGRDLLLELRRWTESTDDYTTVVQSASLSTDGNGRASASLTPEAGYYQIRLSGRDHRGNEVKVEDWLYVFSDAALWQGSASGDLRIAADRDTYAAGDSARLVIESSFSGPALLTFERGTVRREQLVQLTAPLTVVGVPIQPDDAPNIFVTVNAWKEQDTALTPSTPSSLADSRLNTASLNLRVPVTDKTLNITITPDRAVYAPREPATFGVRVTNGRGEPVSAEVSLALVDEAIFSLSDELAGPIFEAFYHERENIVRTYDSLALWRYLFDWGRGGGGGGESLANPRSDFPDTAAWIPVLHTDWNGEALVTFNLPDSLTSWRLTARATTADTQVGEGYINVVTQQPIVVRPLLPRVLTAGDQVELSALVHNYSDSPIVMAVGIDTGTDDRLQVTSQITQSVTLAAGEQRIIGWTAMAKAAGEAQVTVYAKGGDLGDAVRLPIPIQPLAIPDVTAQIGEFTGAFNTELPWPEEALDVSSVRIELSRSIAGSLLNGLEYLTVYPYGCVEQTMSAALPNAVVGRAFYQLGVGDSANGQADLLPKINSGVQRLYGFQHDDGGWGWWFDDHSDAYNTAWVVFGLAVTKEAGYEVDSEVIKRGVDWLAQNLSEMDIRTRAFALYSMAVAGYGDLKATQTLAEQAGNLDAFSRAALAMALHNLGAAADAREMLDLLAGTAVVADGKVYWREGNEDGHYQAKTMSSTIRSTALALDAFVRINPGHPLESGIVRYLMSQRRQEGWGSTNETSFAILALTDHLLTLGAATADTGFTVELNGVEIASGTLGQGEPAVSLEVPAAQMVAGTNALRLRQSGSGRLYYIVSSRIYLARQAIEAAGNVQVSRVYLDPKTRRPLQGALPGQLVQVKLTLTMPDDGFYMLVEDKLPGGLEALNEGLNTSSHDGSLQAYEPYQWESLGYNYKEVRADRVSFFITELIKGPHTFTYIARAVRAGQFAAMPAEAWAMYDPTVWGRSESGAFLVGEFPEASASGRSHD